ncbi:MAG: excinuclease ABC subunit UvrC [Rhodospirillaceae bacterium]|nr:excinuclease ABC subunit UvrC [Rhodospirillaceae bacterium]
MNKKQENLNPLSQGIAVLQKQIKLLGNKPGIYQMLNDKGEVLYIGKAHNLRKRVTNYTVPDRLTLRIQRMIAETRSLEVTITHTEAEALLLESNLIKKILPRYNILLRDDKSFPYIVITHNHPAPQLLKHRGAKTIPGSYYGPFLSGQAVNSTVMDLQRAFLLRSCSDNIYASRNRPCLLYQIKRCAAPCVQRISNEDYSLLVQQAQNFLSGKTVIIQEQLAKQMQEASAQLDFEAAAGFRDRLQALTQIQARQHIFVEGITEADVLGFYQQAGQSCIQVFLYRGGGNYGSRSYFPSHPAEASADEILSAFVGQFYADKLPPREILLSLSLKDQSLLQEALSSKAGYPVHFSVPKRGGKYKIIEHAEQNARESLQRRQSDVSLQTDMLQKLAARFNLPKVPARIEVYDNSHLMGTHAFGAMIAAGAEGFIKSSYRKFAIRTDDGTMGNDDYGMMRQVIRRRLKCDPSPSTDATQNWPDLMLIDGGKGQLQAVNQVLEELGITSIFLIAIAKGPDRNAGRERFFLVGQEPFTLEPQDPLLYFLQRLRDEAHRFAIGAHRQRRQKQLYKSALDDIPGIGAKRKKLLLLHFGSAREVSRAGVEDLQRIPGISQDIAKRVYSYFHDLAENK